MRGPERTPGHHRAKAKGAPSPGNGERRGPRPAVPGKGGSSASPLMKPLRVTHQEAGNPPGCLGARVTHQEAGNPPGCLGPGSPTGRPGIPRLFGGPEGKGSVTIWEVTGNGPTRFPNRKARSIATKCPPVGELLGRADACVHPTSQPDPQPEGQWRRSPGCEQVRGPRGWQEDPWPRPPREVTARRRHLGARERRICRELRLPSQPPSCEKRGKRGSAAEKPRGPWHSVTAPQPTKIRLLQNHNDTKNKPPAVKRRGPFNCPCRASRSSGNREGEGGWGGPAPRPGHRVSGLTCQQPACPLSQADPQGQHWEPQAVRTGQSSAAAASSLSGWRPSPAPHRPGLHGEASFSCK